MSQPSDDAKWREKLTSEQFRVTRQGGTEPAFTGCYWNTKTPGTYLCVCCEQPLFESDTKYESGSGWPSFFRPIHEDSLETRTDHSHGMVRTEILCRNCGAHLGHRFPDGPPPTGQRYCINSAALSLRPRDEGG